MKFIVIVGYPCSGKVDKRMSLIITGWDPTLVPGWVRQIGFPIGESWQLRAVATLFCKCSLFPSSAIRHVKSFSATHPVNGA
jgi:hypothetical protein